MRRECLVELLVETRVVMSLLSYRVNREVIGKGVI